MEIWTERLLLIPATREFTSKLTRKDYQIGQHIPYYLKQLEQDPALYGWGIWFAIRKEDNKIIGDLGFKGNPNTDQEVEVGYSILPPQQGNGYATEAVKGLINWAIGTGLVKRIIAKCFEDNSSSIRVLEKVGMNRISHLHNLLHWEMKVE